MKSKKMKDNLIPLYDAIIHMSHVFLCVKEIDNGSMPDELAEKILYTANKSIEVLEDFRDTLKAIMTYIDECDKMVDVAIELINNQNN